MHYTCRFFTPTDANDTFSRHWENEPDDTSIFSQRGHLFGLLAIKNPQTNNLGSQIISQINQTYFSQTDQDWQTHLKDTLDKISDLWRDQNPSILLVVINQDQLTAVSVGDASLYFKRSDSFSHILSNSSQTVNQISGPVQDHDLLFLTTPDFIKKISSLNNLFSQSDLNSQEDYIRQNLNSFPTSSALVLVNQRGSPSQLTSSPSPQIITPHQSSPSPKFKRKINFSFLTKLIPKKHITISPQGIKGEAKKKKLNLILISISFIALSVSIYVGYQKNDLSKRQQQFSDLETKLIQNLDNIDKVKQLNLEDALSLAQASQDIITQMSTLSVNSDKVDDYQSQIKSILFQTGAIESDSLAQFYTTSLITSNPSYSSFALDQGTLYLLDKDNSRIDSLTTTDTPANQSISQDDLISQVKQLIVFKSDLYALTSDTLYKVKKTNWIKALDLSGLSIKSVQAWGSSLYLLSPSNIYKSTLVNNSLDELVSWLDSDQSIPIGVANLAIDGKIWILTTDAKIIPYLRGIKDNFKMTQSPQTDSASSLVVGTDLDIIAFLSGSNVVMIYTKAGDLVSKYNFGDKNILEISLDESRQTIYLLSADKTIYRLPL